MSTGDASVSAMWPSRKARVLIWFVYCVSWFTALLVPLPPLPEAFRDPGVRFTLHKTVHVAAYAVLALLTVWLRPCGWWRWPLIAFLFAHGVLAEFCQWYFPALGRNGSVKDVIRDWLGVALGLALCMWARLVRADPAFTRTPKARPTSRRAGQRQE
jgi:VanZ family protein